LVEVEKAARSKQQKELKKKKMEALG